MNRKLNLLILACLFCAVLQTGFSQTPGTSGDPLVTKSYLDFAARFRSVIVKAGTALKADGGTMIILMSGQMKVELAKGAMVINLTTGRKISSNVNIPTFNLIMVPDGQECSFKVSKDATLMALGLKDEED